MSVAYIGDAELAGLWHGLGRTEDIGIALQALAIANRAAFMLTYAPNHEEARTLEAPSFENVEPATCPVADWSLVTWAENLLYNCVTNAGTDFAPAVYANQVRAAACAAERETAEPSVDSQLTIERFSGTLRGCVITDVTVVDGCVTRVRVDDETFHCHPSSDVFDDSGHHELPQAEAIAEHVRGQVWPHWEFG